jgi:glycosyltransferase involved in cell wall biosynthesis
MGECRSFGVETMNSPRERLIFAGCARDCAQWLPAVLANIDRLSTLFAETAIVIVENDSTDGTPERLRQWGRNRRNFHLLQLDGLGAEPARTVRLEIARNAYIAAIGGRSHLAKFDYLCVVDLDEVNARPIDPAGVAEGLARLRSDEAAGVFANQLGAYYDLWALRHATHAPGDVWEEVLDYALTHKVSDEVAFAKTFGRRRFSIPPDSAPVEVASAFGGFGIYKLSHVLRNPNPYLGSRVKLLPGGSPGQIRIARWQQCEHVHFHAGIGHLGGKLLIIPAMINLDATGVAFPPGAYRSLLF